MPTTEDDGSSLLESLGERLVNDDGQCSSTQSINFKEKEEEEAMPKQNDESASQEDQDDHLMCRVCRSNEGNLYYPCLCTGSIKYVHQECLTEWLKYSKKEVCELCNYKYSFQAIYRPDMPKALPVNDILKGIAVNAARFLKTWIVYSIVVVAWLGVVPLTAARIYNAVFYASMYDLLVIPALILRTDHMVADIFKGGCLLFLFICTFISLVWLREQIIHGGPQDFLIIPQNDPSPDENEVSSQDGEDLPDVRDAEDVDGFEAHNRERAPEDIPVNLEAPEDPYVPMPVPAPEVDGDADIPAQDDNWRDWDRLGDELTWQRLLGLDGSFVFLEHVFWVISLNTLFTVLFAYSPYKLGFFLLSRLGIQQQIHYFPSLAAILFGYFTFAFIVYLAHAVAGFLRIKTLFRMLGICFLVIKVFLLVLLEIGMFPIICGCWMDLCSLTLFSSTLSSRIASFVQSPTSAVFVHWMVGMVYVFYSASFVLLLREVLRPGVLWFMRNLNDPEFNPIQEMIELPVQRHLQRIVASTSLFFATIFLVVYLPLRVVKRLAPSCLPYNMSLSADTPLSELSLELLILQVVLPALLEQTQARVLLKLVVRVWCQYVGQLLELDRYLLPQEPVEVREAAAPDAAPAGGGGGLAAEHQALLLIRDEPQPTTLAYVRPSWFPIRIVALLILMALTWTLLSSVCFLVPVTIGRAIIWHSTGLHNVHDLYTVGTGLYVCWMSIRLVMLAVDWCNRGMDHMRETIVSYVYLFSRILVVMAPLAIIVPSLMGTYFQLVIVTPLRLEDQQSALFFPWQDWAMGVLHLKIVCASIMMGPDWWLKQAFEQIYQDGLRELNTVRILLVVILPVVLGLGSFLSVPYLLARLYIFIADVDLETSVFIFRFCYPTSLMLIVFCSFMHWQYKKFKGLTEGIRNEKYLVGTQLVNYERGNTPVTHTS